MGGTSVKGKGEVIGMFNLFCLTSLYGINNTGRDFAYRFAMELQEIHDDEYRINRYRKSPSRITGKNIEVTTWIFAREKLETPSRDANILDSREKARIYLWFISNKFADISRLSYLRVKAPRNFDNSLQ